MRENGRKGKRNRRAESFPQKEILLIKKLPTVLGLGAFIANPSYKIPKKSKENTITMGKIRKKAKKMTNISKNVNINMNSAHERQFCTSAKFLHHGAKFSHCGAKFSASLLSLLLLLLSF